MTDKKITVEEAKDFLIKTVCANCLSRTFGKNCYDTDCKCYQALKLISDKLGGDEK